MNNDEKLTSLISKTLPLILKHQTMEDAALVISGLFSIECNDIIHPNKNLNFLRINHQSERLIKFTNNVTQAITETLLEEGYSPEQINIFLKELAEMLDQLLFSH